MTKKKAPPIDGFHWEEWRDGKLLVRGYHDGTTLDGKDAQRDQRALCQAISYSALEKALRDSEKA